MRNDPKSPEVQPPLSIRHGSSTVGEGVDFSLNEELLTNILPTKPTVLVSPTNAVKPTSSALKHVKLIVRGAMGDAGNDVGASCPLSKVIRNH